MAEICEIENKLKLIARRVSFDSHAVAACLLFPLLFRSSLLTLSEVLCSQSSTYRAAGKTEKRSRRDRELTNEQLRKVRELFCEPDQTSAARIEKNEKLTKKNYAIIPK